MIRINSLPPSKLRRKMNRILQVLGSLSYTMFVCLWIVILSVILLLFLPYLLVHYGIDRLLRRGFLRPVFHSFMRRRLYIDRKVKDESTCFFLLNVLFSRTPSVLHVVDLSRLDEDLVGVGRE